MKNPSHPSRLLSKFHVLTVPLTLFSLWIPAQAAPDISGAASPFEVKFDAGAISSLRRAGDSFSTDYVASEKRLGEVILRYRGRDGAWQNLNTEALSKAKSATYEASADGTRYSATYRALDDSYGKTPALELRNQFAKRGNALEWTMTVRNLSNRPREIDDWALPLPMNTSFVAGKPVTESVLKHSFVSGNNSFLFWMRSNSVGPFLTLTPQPNTPLEYWEAGGYRVFIQRRWALNDMLDLQPAGVVSGT